MNTPREIRAGCSVSMDTSPLDPGYPLSLGQTIRDTYRLALLYASRGLVLEAHEQQQRAENALSALVHEAQAAGQ